jgi:glycosyltransferase involved in cell wall biosynthesis
VTWPRGLERELSRFAPDVVVVSEFGPATLRAFAWCRMRRRALVVLTEVTSEGEKTLVAPQRLLHRLLAPRVDGLIAVSSAARSRLLALGAAPQRVALSLQPIDEDALAGGATAGRATAGGATAAGATAGGATAGEALVEEATAGGATAGEATSRTTPVEVLTVSRLVPDKDVRALIEAFSAAGLHAQEASLAIVGGGPLEGELIAQAQALGVKARFFGAAAASELPQRYAAARVFVLCSRYEPFGVALREAVVAGLPVICSTAVGAVADLAQDGVNALLFAPGDVDALAQALRRLCRDPELRSRLGMQSRRIAEGHPLDADVESFAAMVSQAAARLQRG